MSTGSKMSADAEELRTSIGLRRTSVGFLRAKAARYQREADELEKRIDEARAKLRLIEPKKKKSRKRTKPASVICEVCKIERFSFTLRGIRVCRKCGRDCTDEQILAASLKQPGQEGVV